jgi:hypothetical protein
MKIQMEGVKVAEYLFIEEDRDGRVTVTHSDAGRVERKQYTKYDFIRKFFSER